MQTGGHNAAGTFHAGASSHAQPWPAIGSAVSDAFFMKESAESLPFRRLPACFARKAYKESQGRLAVRTIVPCRYFRQTTQR
jgi:hypothetical protein